ncbi:MAG TPA: glycosyltransferase family 2 protein [Phycisphaerae bacterium]|nr:glycosyltransferase family 2 protein [Phycisphaerae bacterium]
MASPLATVIIPNYNGRRFLPNLLESLAAQRGVESTIIIVDDVSTDDSVEYVQGRWPAVQLIRHVENVGFAASCNAGIRAATTPFVVLLNNDTHVEANWLAEGLRPFDEPDVGSVASLALLAEPPHLIDTAGDVYSVAGGAVKRKHLCPREDSPESESAPFSPSGVSAFYRRDALEKTGLLDERFESYYEDVDLGFRMAWAGYRCVFAPGSVCYHHLSASYHPRSWRYHYNSARNAEIVWWSHMPRRVRFLPAHLVFLAMQVMHKTWQGVGPAYVAGKLGALGHWGHVLHKRRESVGRAQVSTSKIEEQLVRDWWKLHVRSRGSTSNPTGGA